jgi:sugar/nucleoside kinase (ribokinase family)
MRIGVLGFVFFEIYSSLPPAGIPPGEELFLSEMPIRFGGALNTASVIQSLGVSTKLFVPSGHGVLDRVLRETFKNQNLDFETFASKDNPAVSIVFRLPQGDRSFLSHIDEGAFQQFRAAQGLSWMHIAGLKEAFAVRKELQKLQSWGTRISVCGSWAPQELEVLKDHSFWDLLFLNEKEAHQAFGSVTNVFSYAQLLQKDLVVTRGEKSVLALFAGEKMELPVSKNIQVVDSTGAGDALAAGTLAGLTLGLSPQNALKLGIDCAALILQQTSGVPLESSHFVKLRKEYAAKD